MVKSEYHTDWFQTMMCSYRAPEDDNQMDG